MNALKIASAALLFSVAVVVGGAANAAWPDKPVHIVIGAAPGGATDFQARLIQPELSKLWGQPVIIDNKPGADGVIGADFVSQAAPDGYTILFASMNFAINASVVKTNYDPIKSFKPITLLSAVSDFLLVHPDVPANTLEEFVAYAKQHPGELNYASAGKYNMEHIEMEVFAKLTGLDMKDIPFDGGGNALLSVLKGETQLEFGPISNSLEQVKAGQLKALAVGTNQRVSTAPEIPTVAEVINQPDFRYYSWFGMMAPAGTPDDIVQKIRDDVAKVYGAPAIQDRLPGLGYISFMSQPDEFAKTIADDIKKWGDLIKQYAPE